MIKKYILLFVLLMVSNVSLAAGTNNGFGIGDDCKDKHVTEEQFFNAIRMTQWTTANLNTLRKKYADRGQKLDFVFMSRTGTDTSSVKVVKNNQPLDQFFKEANSSAKSEDNRRRLLERAVIKDAARSDLRFSHMGIAYFDKNERWTYAHMLYKCGKNAAGTNAPAKDSDGSSHIWDEGMARFFLDDPYDYGVQIIIPTEDVRNRLDQLLVDRNKTRTVEFKNLKGGKSTEELWDFNADLAYDYLQPKYNAASVIWNLEDQNSNQWPLFILTLGMDEKGKINSQSQALRFLKNTGYKPTRVFLGRSFKYSAVKVAHRYIDTLDVSKQPYYRDDVLEVSTVLSVIEYMQRNYVLDDVVEIFLPKSLKYSERNKTNKTFTSNDRDMK